MSSVYEFAIAGAKPMFVDPKPIGCLHQPSLDRTIDYARVFFENGRYTNDGELAQLLEKRLAKVHNVKHAVVFANGFLGSLLVMDALRLPGRQEVILPALAYQRLDDAVSWVGLTPRFCDVDRDTLSATTETVKRCITDETALILIQHSSVGFADIDGICAMASELGIPVLIDSVLYFGAIKGAMVGGSGNAELFSLNATKFLNGFEGGYITTNDDELAKRITTTKRFGFDEEDAIAIGESLNAKLNEPHAAMALASLDKIDDFIVNYKEQYNCYKRELADIQGIRFLTHDEDNQHCFRNVAMLVELLDSWPLTRDETLKILQAENILARAYYIPLHLKEVGYERHWDSLSVTESVHSRLVTLPEGAHVTVEDIYKIAAFLRKTLKFATELKARGVK